VVGERGGCGEVFRGNERSITRGNPTGKESTDMIKSLELKNFTIFSHLKIDFSPKINIIIGENGTGKTHLLKAAYALSSGGKLFQLNSDVEESKWPEFLTDRLIRIFRPLENKLGKLHHKGSQERAELALEFEAGQFLKIHFHNNSQSLVIQGTTHYDEYNKLPTFITTKEVISFIDGFISSYDRRELSFDETYKDICQSIELKSIRPESLHEKSKWAMEEIKKICEGSFSFNGSRATFKTMAGEEYSTNIIAEGFRKLGMLSRLIETGEIRPGISGSLFWDEPEGNMNPKLMKLLVKILLELSRNGQQIILATHDYVFLKWFDLLGDRSQGDEIRYHTLYRDEKNYPSILLNSTEDYLLIEPNPIDEAFDSLINKELDQTIGELRK
jgi:AAA15 family ATPase/GTPase